MNIKGIDLQLDANGKLAYAYLASPGDGGQAPGILVLHAWWGLKPVFKGFCDKLAEAGFTALAPDLYQGRTAETVEEAEVLLGQRDLELMGDTLQAAIKHMTSLTQGKLGLVGWSMGASWALQAAANEPDVAAVVLFYGSGGEDFNQVKAKLQGHFGDSDSYEPLEGVRAMQADMQAAGLDVRMHIYPAAQHWFMEEDRPQYSPSHAAAAWKRTIDFLKETLC